MRKRSPLITAFALVIIGTIGLTNISRLPRFAFFHSVDILQLLASGMCFGCALTLLVIALRGRPGIA